MEHFMFNNAIYVQQRYVDWKSRPIRWRYFLYASYDKGKTWQMLFVDKPNVWQVILQKVEQKKLFIIVNALDTIKAKYHDYLHIDDMFSYWVSQDKGKTWQKLESQQMELPNEVTTIHQVKIGRYTLKNDENSISRATNKVDSHVVLKAEECGCVWECDGWKPNHSWVFGFCKVDSSLLAFTRWNCNYNYITTNGIYRSIDSGSTWKKVYDTSFDCRSYIVSDSVVLLGTANKGLLAS